ncbi:MAG: NAD-dependent epimerase/dehydratase family protein [Deltaproteobacteria bacterium]|nr:NAD-dependent epimerase/dehydratase family protein [Deltaproteobacteria bacterium]
MKVLVTGGCGFLGSHVCEMFRNQGWDVVAYDNMTKSELARTGYQTDAARHHCSSFLASLGVDVVRADIRRLDDLLDCSTGCDYIVHTAAQPAVTISIEDPLLDVETNVVGTVNALEAARRQGLPIASCATVHVYGNWVNERLAETETRYTLDPPEIAEDAATMEGYLTPLHGSKSSAEQYVRVYASTYGLRASSFRLTGIYGPRQLGGEDHGWVANFSIRNALDWPITLFGSGKQVRDIVYAADVASAFLAFYERGEAGVYNIGGGIENAISLLECIDLIDATSGHKSKVRFDEARFGDLKYFVCDIGRAREKLGWEPRVRPSQGVPLLIDWIEENRDLFAAPE